MKTALASAAFTLLACSALAQKPAPAPAPHASDLAFLSGSWETVSGPMTIEEHWTCPVADSLIGMGRTVKNGKTVFFEYLRIEERADGVFYVAQPKGGPPTPFKLVELKASSAVFENPQHDFPKRIRYTRGEGDTLVARVEGDAASKEKAEEFRYTRRSGGCK